MPDKKKDDKSYFGRGRDIDSIIENAEGSNGERDIQKNDPKNPYPPGSARAKLWERREADRKAKKKE